MKITRVAALAAASGLVMSGCSGGVSGGGGTVIRITSNSVKGGKNADEADWYHQLRHPQVHRGSRRPRASTSRYLPAVRRRRRAVQDRRSRSTSRASAGADVIAIDGIWVGEFAQAGYIKPLTDVVGPGRRRRGTAGRRSPRRCRPTRPSRTRRTASPAAPTAGSSTSTRSCSPQAGPARRLAAEELAGHPRRRRASSRRCAASTPIQINAGTAMGEATTMQGVLPLLVGTGARDLHRRQVAGRHPAARDVLGFYKQLYDQGLGDKNFQQDAKGRDESFAAFADGKVGILLEGDYFWRSVVNPDNGRRPDGRPRHRRRLRLIPAESPGTRRRRAGLRLDVRRRRLRASTRTPSTRSRPGSCSSSCARPTPSRPRSRDGRPDHRAQDVNERGARQRPAAVVHRRQRCCRSRDYRPGLPSTRRCRRRCSRRPPTSSRGKRRRGRRAYQQSRGEGGRRRRQRHHRLTGARRQERSAAGKARPRRRRAGRRRRRRGLAFVAPRSPHHGLPGRAGALDDLPRADRLPAHRRPGRGDPQFVGIDNYTRRARRPGLPRLAVADAAVRPRLGDHRADRARLRPGLDAARRRGAAVRAHRRDAGAAGLDPAELGRRVPVDRAPRPRRRHAQRRCSTRRAPPGCSTTRWRSIIVFNTWRGTAFSMMLFSAALRRVPPSQLESARLAGAVGLAAAARRGASRTSAGTS